MVKNERLGDLRNAITAAAASFSAEFGNGPGDVAQGLKHVLEAALADVGVEVETTPIPYHISGKMPIMITLSEQDPRLLWYRRGMSSETLSDELFWLLSDLPLLIGRIPA